MCSHRILDRETASTGAVKFDHRVARMKPLLLGSVLKRLGDGMILNFGDSAAFLANQELYRMMGMIGIAAWNERVQAFDL